MSFDTGDNAADKGDNTDVKAGTDADKAKGQPSQNPEEGQRVFLIAGERAFRDPDSAVKHIEHAQSHIATLEKERDADRKTIAELQAENERLKKIADAIGSHTNPGKDVQTEHLSKEELAKHAAELAAGLIQSQQTEKAKNANLDAALKLAEATYGDKYKAVVAEKATALGLSLPAVDALAKDSPDAFKRLFIEEKKGSGFQPTRGTVNTASLNQQSGENQPRNITKMKEKDRMAYVASLLKAG